MFSDIIKTLSLDNYFPSWFIYSSYYHEPQFMARENFQLNKKHFSLWQTFRWELPVMKPPELKWKLRRIPTFLRHVYLTILSSLYLLSSDYINNLISSLGKSFFLLNKRCNEVEGRRRARKSEGRKTVAKVNSCFRSKKFTFERFHCFFFVSKAP